MKAKRNHWRHGEGVIFNDMGNWGMGVVDEEGSPSDSSRWYWILVREGMDPLAKRRRLVRADDLLPYADETWAAIKRDLGRLSELEIERRAIMARLKSPFQTGESDS